jgi:Flp pilus assembly protein TadD/predicted Zn-dependent protease with MMP-like domain
MRLQPHHRARSLAPTLTRVGLAVSALALAGTGCHRKSENPPQAAVVKPSAQGVSSSLAAPNPSVSSVKPGDLPESTRAAPKAPKPPAQPCLELSADAEPALAELLEQAAREFEKTRYDHALECAREASRIDPGSVAAHHFRAAAMAELGLLDESRTAYARALALDPDDPEVLRSAADLYVRRLGGRDDLELALDYVRRALPRAQKAKDKGLQKELYLLQAMAMDDLGKPMQALSAATKAAELDPKDREARREKGVALFELSKFDLAKTELAKLAIEEPDAWAEQYLGLIAERAEDYVGATAHFAKARALDPDAFDSLSATATAVHFGEVVQDEMGKLPPEIKQGLGQSDFEVEDLPDVSDLIATEPPLSPGILGLFRPPQEGAPADAKPAIILYRRNLARAVRSEEELHREVRDTLLHEVGHLNGEDDDQLRDRGL